MPTTYEFAIASDVLEGPEGATYVGITPIAGLEHIPGLTAEQVQDALVAIKILLDAKLSGIQDNNVDITFRSKINFTGEGFTITDDATNGVTEFNIPSLSDYPHVENVLDEGVDRGVHRKIDFQGTGITVVEDTVNDKYVVTVPGTYIQRISNAADSLGDRPELRITGNGMTLTEDTVNNRYVLNIDAFDPPPIVQRVSDEGDTLGEQPELRVISDWAVLTENTVDGRYELLIPTPEDVPDPPVPATESITGLVRLNRTPTVSGDPIAVEAFDPRLEDERTPEDGSVTLPKADDDVIFFLRCTSTTRPTDAKFGQMIFETDTLSCQKNVSDIPEVPNWVAIGSLADIPIADDGEANPYELVRANDSRLSNRREPELESVTLPTAAPQVSFVYICTSTTRPTLPKRGQIIFEEDTSVVMKNLGAPAEPNWQPLGNGEAAFVLQDEGVTIGPRQVINVVGVGGHIYDDPDNERTILEVPGLQVLDEGVDVSEVVQLNFIGFTVTDDPLNERIDITPPGPASKATEVNYGTSKLSTPAASSTDPIVAGTNDTRIPTQDENDALVGTSGTPSSTNKYVTNADTRVPTQGENDALVGTSGTPSTTNKYITDADARVPSQVENDALVGTFGTPGSANRFITETDTAYVKGVLIKDYRSGLDLRWNTPGTNGTHLTITPGAAWVPSLNRILDVPTTLTGPSMTFAASTAYYVYLYDNAGTPAIEISTTAPAAPYKGTAATKTGDTSRRYLGYIRTLASAAMAKFWDGANGQRHWLENLTILPFFIYSGTSSAWTAISAAGVVPPTARIARLQIANEGGSGSYVYLTEGDYNSATAGPVSVSANSGVVYPQTNVVREMQLNSSQQFGYFVTAGGVIYAFCLGYKEER